MRALQDERQALVQDPMDLNEAALAPYQQWLQEALAM
jgi:hypothetical protein